MFRVSSSSRRGSQYRLLIKHLTHSSSQNTAPVSIAIRGIRTSCAARNASAVEPPKISNFADVEEVRETSAPIGSS